MRRVYVLFLMRDNGFKTPWFGIKDGGYGFYWSRLNETLGFSSFSRLLRVIGEERQMY